MAKRPARALRTGGSIRPCRAPFTSPLFKPFEFDADIKRRKARIVIPGAFGIHGPSDRSSTGLNIAFSISLPNGIEFDVAEVASGITKTMASIALDLKGFLLSFRAIRQSGTGVNPLTARHKWVTVALYLPGVMSVVSAHCRPSDGIHRRERTGIRRRLRCNSRSRPSTKPQRARRGSD